MRSIPKGKLVNLAALIFLAFGFLWLGLFAAGQAGVAWFESTRYQSLSQGCAALLAVTAIVSRLKAAPTIVAGLSIVILLAPGMAPSSSSSASSGRGDSVHLVAVAAQLALPAPLRTTETLAHSAHVRGYQDHPAQRKELDERRERVLAWITANPGPAKDAATATHFNGPISRLPERVGKAMGTDTGGEDWIWYPVFMKNSHSRGMNDSVQPLSEEDRMAAEGQARSWLEQHPDLIGGGAPAELYQEEKRRAVSLTSLWLLLPTFAMMFLGRGSFTRPLDLGRLPGWTGTGLKLLLRQREGAPEPTALLRVGAGGLILLGGVLLIAAIKAAGLTGARALMLLTVGSGATLVFSGLNLNAEED